MHRMLLWRRLDAVLLMLCFHLQRALFFGRAATDRGAATAPRCRPHPLLQHIWMQPKGGGIEVLDPCLIRGFWAPAYRTRGFWAPAYRTRGLLGPPVECNTGLAGLAWNNFPAISDRKNAGQLALKDSLRAPRVRLLEPSDCHRSGQS